MKLLIQDYLSTHSLADLAAAYSISARRHADFSNLVMLKYSQIGSPKAEPIVQQCRGIILDESRDWAVVSYPFDKFFNYAGPQVDPNLPEAASTEKWFLLLRRPQADLPPRCVMLFFSAAIYFNLGNRCLRPAAAQLALYLLIPVRPRRLLRVVGSNRSQGFWLAPARCFCKAFQMTTCNCPSRPSVTWPRDHRPCRMLTRKPPS